VGIIDELLRKELEQERDAAIKDRDIWQSRHHVLTESIRRREDEQRTLELIVSRLEPKLYQIYNETGCWVTAYENWCRLGEGA